MSTEAIPIMPTTPTTPATTKTPQQQWIDYLQQQFQYLEKRRSQIDEREQSLNRWSIDLQDREKKLSEELLCIVKERTSFYGSGGSGRRGGGYVGGNGNKRGGHNHNQHQHQPRDKRDYRDHKDHIEYPRKRSRSRSRSRSPQRHGYSHSYSQQTTKRMPESPRYSYDTSPPRNYSEYMGYSPTKPETWAVSSSSSSLPSSQGPMIHPERSAIILHTKDSDQ